MICPGFGKFQQQIFLRATAHQLGQRLAAVVTFQIIREKMLCKMSFCSLKKIVLSAGKSA